MAKLEKFTGNFTVVPNDIINNPNLSLKAKGMWLFIQSKPNGWEFSVERIAAQNKDGVTSVSNALKELENLGLLKRKRIYENNRCIGIEYQLHLLSNIENLNVENLSLGNLTLENLSGDSNKDISKKDLSKKDIYIEGQKIEPKKPQKKDYELDDEMLADNFNKYYSHMTSQSVMERLSMNLMLPRTNGHLVFKEFLETCYAAIAEKNNKLQVEQYFINWVRAKEYRIEEAINNQLKRLRHEADTTSNIK